MRNLLVAVALSTLLAACGSPQAGDECKENSATCNTDATALFCEAGTYREIACRAASGCIEDDSNVICAIQARANDACLARQEGQAQCDAANPNNAFVCTRGRWTATDCDECAVQIGKVVCMR